jgi:hypothetical protein
LGSSSYYHEVQPFTGTILNHAVFVHEAESYYVGGGMTTVPYSTYNSYLSPKTNAFLMSYVLYGDSCLINYPAPSIPSTPYNPVNTFSASQTISLAISYDLYL